jgi:hypothetical protein
MYNQLQKMNVYKKGPKLRVGKREVMGVQRNQETDKEIGLSILDPSNGSPSQPRPDGFSPSRQPLAGEVDRLVLTRPYPLVCRPGHVPCMRMHVRPGQVDGRQDVVRPWRGRCRVPCEGRFGAEQRTSLARSWGCLAAVLPDSSLGIGHRSPAVRRRECCSRETRLGQHAMVGLGCLGLIVWELYLSVDWRLGCLSGIQPDVCETTSLRHACTSTSVGP